MNYTVKIAQRIKPYKQDRQTFVDMLTWNVSHGHNYTTTGIKKTIFQVTHNNTNDNSWLQTNLLIQG